MQAARSARDATPSTMKTLPRVRPSLLLGATSPKPTVENVITASATFLEEPVQPTILISLSLSLSIDHACCDFELAKLVRPGVHVQGLVNTALVSPSFRAFQAIHTMRDARGSVGTRTPLLDGNNMHMPTANAARS